MFSNIVIRLRVSLRTSIYVLLFGLLAACDSSSTVEEAIPDEEPIPSFETLSADISYEYDSLNRLTAVRYGNGDVIRYSYDEEGNILTVEMDRAE